MRTTWWAAIGVSVAAALAHAQAPPDPQKIMAEIQALDERYQAVEAERAAERSEVRERVCQEELEKARAKAPAEIAAGRPFDPMAAADHGCRQRLEGLRAEWKQQDAALAAKKQAEMAEIVGMPTGMPGLPQR